MNDKLFVDLRFLVIHYHKVAIDNYKDLTKEQVKKKIFNYIYTQKGTVIINKRNINMTEVQEMGILKVKQFINSYIDNVWYKR